MSNIINHFQTITQIPHCSKEADKLFNFLVNFAKERHYRVEVDATKNIFIYKGKPNLCLQAHYDMVCMGDAPKIETYIEDNIMRAKKSSLGADNGIAIAMMMELMDRAEDLEFLITSDEEIGLIGANKLDFTLQSKFMLNLDTEEEAEVYVGCAGGIDIIAEKQDRYIEGHFQCYEIAVKGALGGHSGVDIDKNIPSAIKVLGKYLKDNNITQLASIYAGERRNSIPVNAIAIIRSEKELENTTNIKVRKLLETPDIFSQSEQIIDLINQFNHGVHTSHREFNIPNISVNLAIISSDERGGLIIEVTPRAMDSEGLEKISTQKIDFLKKYGFDVKSEFKYPAWRPNISNFTNLVNNQMKKVFGRSKISAIHAGLECGVISEKYPQIKIASIGPTIRYPHSMREEVNLNSVKQTFTVLENIIKLV